MDPSLLLSTRVLHFLLSVKFASYSNLLVSPFRTNGKYLYPRALSFSLFGCGESVVFCLKRLISPQIFFRLNSLFSMRFEKGFPCDHQSVVVCFPKVVTFRNWGLPELEFLGK